MVITTIDESQRKAAKVVGLAYLVTFATVVYVNFGIPDRLTGFSVGHGFGPSTPLTHSVIMGRPGHGPVLATETNIHSKCHKLPF